MVGQLQQMLDLLIDFPFLDSTGHWSCTLGGYVILQLQNLEDVDDFTLPNGIFSTRWTKHLPRKVFFIGAYG